jgi:phage tail-like protein
MGNKNQFLVEIDGVASVNATKVDGLDVIKHTPSKLMIGNRGNPIHGLGNHEVGEVTVTHAEVMGQTGREVWRWHRDYIKRVDLVKRNVRVVQFEEDGATVAQEYELRGCVPTSFKSDGTDANSGDPQFFTFGFQPEDSERY